LVFFSIASGIIVFAGFLWLIKVLFKAHTFNPLLGLCGIYFCFHFLSDKLFSVLPKSWKVKQINNLMEFDGTLGFMLHLNEPKMSAFDSASATFKLCLIGYFIYTFTSKKSILKNIKKRQKSQEQNT